MSHDAESMPAEERLAAWVRDHGRAVRGYLLATLRERQLADDLTQEVFLRAWQARERYREAGTPRAYLMRIADRLACDTARRRRAVLLDEAGWRQIEPEGRQEDPALAAVGAEQSALLTRALEGLSPAQRRVLLLRYFGQMSFAEIAAAVEAPLNTVLSHCHRGLEALKTILGDHDEQRPSETVADPRRGHGG